MICSRALRGESYERIAAGLETAERQRKIRLRSELVRFPDETFRILDLINERARGGCAPEGCTGDSQVNRARVRIHSETGVSLGISRDARRNPAATLDRDLVLDGRVPLAHRGLLRNDLAVVNYFEAFERDARESRSTHLERFGDLQRSPRRLSVHREFDQRTIRYECPASTETG